MPERSARAARLAAGPSPRLRLLVIAVVLLALILAGGYWLHHRLDRSNLDRALALVPAGTLRVSFTDWAQIRTALKAGDLHSDAAVRSFIDRAGARDLSAASSIEDAAVALHRKFGFSPANATWEAYAQSRAGATMVLQLPGDTDMGRITRNLAKLGYQRPASATGVWDGGADLVSALDPTLSPELQYVVVDADRHLVVSSDTSSYAKRAGEVVRGKADALRGGSASLADTMPAPASAYVWTGDFACSDLSMSQAAPDDQSTADGLVRRVGGVNPLTGLVIGMSTKRVVVAALGFADAEQARKNLRPRARLLVGDAVGRGLSYADYFRLTRSRTEGSTVLLTMKARERTGFALSQMNSGPVLFATC